MASIDWSDLNDKFLKFDKLCENLCKEFNIDLNNEQSILNENIKFDISSYKNDNLLSYTCLLPNKLRPLTYSNVTNQLLNQLINDEWFKNDGTFLRTLEKGVFHPVLHYSTIDNQDNFIELFNVNKFGNNYTLYQSIYKELYCIELPLVNCKKLNQNNDKISIKNSDEISIKNNNDKLTINTNFNQNNSITINQETNQFKNEDYKSFDYLSTDYSSTDSGCVSLNSTNDYTNDSFDTNDNLKINKTLNLQNSLESLNSSFNSNDSILNSIINDSSIKSNKQIKNDDYDCLNIKNRNYIKTNLNIDKNLFNKLNYLNDGHLIIGFRINDNLFRKIFENNIFDISGARLLTPLAAKFGLTKLRLLKRIALNTDHNNSNNYLTTFNYCYLLHAEFLNLTYENEIYLLNFVHRLRLRSLGSVTLYSNLK